MDAQERISAALGRLHAASPAGFAIALHVRFTAPRYLLQSYAKDWLDTYTRLGLVLHDPVVRWGFENTGWIRWSALSDADAAGVLARAADHGLAYGVVMAHLGKGSRSMAGFARPDRELSDAEIAAITTDFTELHNLTHGAETLSPRVHETLRQMSVFLTHG